MEAGHQCVTFKCIATASILEVSLLLKLKGLIYGLKIKNKASALIHRLRRTIFRRGSGDHPTALERTIVSLCFPASEKDSGYWLEHSFLLPNCELSRHIETSWSETGVRRSDATQRVLYTGTTNIRVSETLAEQ